MSSSECLSCEFLKLLDAFVNRPLLVTKAKRNNATGTLTGSFVSNYAIPKLRRCYVPCPNYEVEESLNRNAYPVLNCFKRSKLDNSSHATSVGRLV